MGRSFYGAPSVLAPEPAVVVRSLVTLLLVLIADMYSGVWTESWDHQERTHGESGYGGSTGYGVMDKE